MNFYKVVITTPAEDDLRGIADYIARELREPAAAQQLIANIGNAVIDLEQMPLRNALVNDERLAIQGIRNLMVNYYIVFYVVNEKNKRVTIIRILYGKREWNNLL